MKSIKTTLSLILMICFLAMSPAKADTIDVWHVHYNNIKIKEFNDFSKGRIVIDSKKYKKGDKIVVRHFDDTPCENCPIFLFVEMGKKELNLEALGEGNPLSFDVKHLIDLHKFMNVTINVYYAGSHNGTKNPRKLLFQIDVI